MIVQNSILTLQTVNVNDLSPQTNMENKEELEKLVESLHPWVARPARKEDEHAWEIKKMIVEEAWVRLKDPLRTALSLADKQGYMRGEEHGRKRRDQELLIMMDEVEKKGWDFKRFISTFSSMVDSQSHDAISKLKEV